MSAPLVAALSARIAATGPIPFDEFMRASLYDVEHGFFATGPLRSVAGGDFLTSPEVSPWFGRTVARFVAGVAGDRRHPVTVVDAGAGSGSLLRPLLADLADLGSRSTPTQSRCRRRRGVALRTITGVDRPPAAGRACPWPERGVRGRRRQRAARQPAGGAGGPLRRRLGGTSRRAGRRALYPGRPPTPGPRWSTWADRFAGPVAEGGIVEVQLAGIGWVSGRATPPSPGRAAGLRLRGHRRGAGAAAGARGRCAPIGATTSAPTRCSSPEPPTSPWTSTSPRRWRRPSGRTPRVGLRHPGRVPAALGARRRDRPAPAPRSGNWRSRATRCGGSRCGLSTPTPPPCSIPAASATSGCMVAHRRS